MSVAMDSYFLRFDRIRVYYLGKKTFELNRKRAEQEIARLNEEKKDFLAQKKELEEQKERLAQSKEFFTEYDYDAHGKYQAAARDARTSKTRLDRLKKAQADNQEYLELNEQAARLGQEQQAVQAAYNQKLQEKSNQDTVIQRCSEKVRDEICRAGSCRNSSSGNMKQRIIHWCRRRWTPTKNIWITERKGLAAFWQRKPGNVSRGRSSSIKMS